MKKIFFLLLIACCQLPIAFSQGVKISDLPAISGNPADLLLPAAEAGATKKVTGAQLVQSKLSISDTTGKWLYNILVRNDSLFKEKGGTQTFVSKISTAGALTNGSGTTINGTRIDWNGSLIESANIDLAGNIIAWMDSNTYPSGLFSVDGTTGNLIFGDINSDVGGTHIIIADGAQSIILAANQTYIFNPHMILGGADATNDMYYRNSSGRLERIPIGSNGQALRVVSGNIEWRDTVPAAGIPTLEEVTDEGNETTNDIKIANTKHYFANSRPVLGADGDVTNVGTEGHDGNTFIHGFSYAKIGLEDGANTYYNASHIFTGGPVSVGGASPDSILTVDYGLHVKRGARFSGLIQQSLDTTNYKLGVFDSNGDLVKMYWPTFGGGSMVYPPAGIPTSTGSDWGTSITDNSTNWNTAHGWGNHASAGYITASSTDNLTNKDLTSGTNTFPTFNQNTTGSAGTLTTTRTIWGQNFNGSANVTGDITLGASNLTMTGSLAGTGSRVTKGWFTDIESTNMPTVGGTSLSSTFSPIAGSASINTVGTIGTGNWQGSIIGPAYLGTGSSITTKFLRGDGTWQTIAGGGDMAAATYDPANISQQLVGISATQTLTNKRITARTGTTTSSATPTINTDNVEFYSLTAQAANITSFTTNLSGTPSLADKLWISITDNGTPRTIAWGASFSGSLLPATTVASVNLNVLLFWNGSTWYCVAVQ